MPLFSLDKHGGGGGGPKHGQYLQAQALVQVLMSTIFPPPPLQPVRESSCRHPPRELHRRAGILLVSCTVVQASSSRVARVIMAAKHSVSAATAAPTFTIAICQPATQKKDSHYLYTPSIRPGCYLWWGGASLTLQ